MWKYEKRLQYPINIKKKDVSMAKMLITQYGGTYYQRDSKKTRLLSVICFKLFHSHTPIKKVLARADNQSSITIKVYHKVILFAFLFRYIFLKASVVLLY